MHINNLFCGATFNRRRLHCRVFVDIIIEKIFRTKQPLRNAGWNFYSKRIELIKSRGLNFNSSLVWRVVVFIIAPVSIPPVYFILGASRTWSMTIHLNIFYNIFPYIYLGQHFSFTSASSSVFLLKRDKWIGEKIYYFSGCFSAVFNFSGYNSCASSSSVQPLICANTM